VFTGVVEGTGSVETVAESASGRQLRIDGGGLLDAVGPGESVSVSGVCLTVERSERGRIAVFVSSETEGRTTLSGVEAGDPVNLERALPVDGRLDGHVVQGHVDATTTLADRRRNGDGWAFEWALPDGHERYVVEKGSIALDGVSLTVADRRSETFTTAIIPETLDRTTLDGLATGDAVNVEVDVLAKYVEGLLPA